jgi:hypothetical protein
MVEMSMLPAIKIWRNPMSAMNTSGILNSAGAVDDMAAKVRTMVDQAELYPDSPTSFQEIRLVLNSIQREAQHIMSLAKSPEIETLPSPDVFFQGSVRKEKLNEERQDV